MYSQWLLFAGLTTLLHLASLLVSPLGDLLAWLGYWPILLTLAWYGGGIARDHLVARTFVSAHGRAVLVTGCDSGFGPLDARALYSYGFTVYATVLSKESEGAQSLSKDLDDSSRLIVLEMDVTKADDVAWVMKRIRSDGIELWALVNNAGLFSVSPFEWISDADFSRVLDVNLLGYARVTRAALPLLRASRGRLINMASIMSHVAPKHLSAYVASKFAVRGWSDALRRELAPCGIAVATLEPYAYATQMSNAALYRTVMQANWDALESDIQSAYPTDMVDKLSREYAGTMVGARTNLNEVVDAVLDAVTTTRPKTVYRCMNWPLAFNYFLARVTPTEWGDYCIELSHHLYILCWNIVTFLRERLNVGRDL